MDRHLKKQHERIQKYPTAEPQHQPFQNRKWGRGLHVHFFRIRINLYCPPRCRFYFGSPNIQDR